MFGSDWPVCLMAASYEKVVQTARSLTQVLSDAEKAQVFHSTAMRAYAMEDSPV
jgi:L-fuconolactonase